MQRPDFPIDPTAELPRAYGGAPLIGRLRVSPEDFVVAEHLGYSADGEGEHAFLQVRKRGLNTADVARELARFAGVRQVDVGFAGLKDRHAVTTQYFSVHLPGRPDPDWRELNRDALQVVDVRRHRRKIRRGSLRGNRFVLVLRELAGGRQQAEDLLQMIARRGVPNYFGPQRFGRQASNLYRAAQLLAGEGRRPKPEQLRMITSAARSYLFNRVLAARVGDTSWDRALQGEVMLLGDSGRQFHAEPEDPQLEARTSACEIHPSGPLPGDAGRCLQPDGQAATIEQVALSDDLARQWCDGLARRRVQSERRSLRLLAEDLNWEWLDDGSLRLTFGLTSGGFATTLVRELVREPEVGDAGL